VAHVNREKKLKHTLAHQQK